MRPLSYYREIEDSIRKDKDEGEGRVTVIRPRPVIDLARKSITQETGEVFFSTASINPSYIACFSGPQVELDYLAHRYGQHLLRIDEPNILVSEIGACVERYPNMPNTMWLYCIQVRYDRDQLVEKVPEPASEERSMMSYGQKADIFRRDCEYRVVLRLPVPFDPPKELKVELQKRLEYVDIVRLPSSRQNASK